MDCDELIDELISCGPSAADVLEQPTEAPAHPAATSDMPRQQSCQEVQKYRERLAALVAGGQAKQYGLVVHGKALTADQIDALDNSEIEKLYARYEARLGAAMTKTLGSAALQIYAGVIGQFVPIPDQLGLIRDLESDPFVGHALSSATCELYHRYGMWLAPLTTTLITLKHARFGHCCPVRVDDVDGERSAEQPRDGIADRVANTSRDI